MIAAQARRDAAESVCSADTRLGRGGDLVVALVEGAPLHYRSSASRSSSLETALRGTPAAWADGVRGCPVGERLPSKGRQDEQAIRQGGSVWE